MLISILVIKSHVLYFQFHPNFKRVLPIFFQENPTIPKLLKKIAKHCFNFSILALVFITRNFLDTCYMKGESVGL